MELVVSGSWMENKQYGNISTAIFLFVCFVLSEGPSKSSHSYIVKAIWKHLPHIWEDVKGVFVIIIEI